MRRWTTWRPASLWPAGGRRDEWRPVDPTRRAYGVQRVCCVWARPRSSVYARRQALRDCVLGHRRGPVGAAPDEVLVVHIRRVLEASYRIGR